MHRLEKKVLQVLLFASSCALVTGCAQQAAPTAAALKLPPPKPQRVDFANLTAHTSAVDAGASVNADELLARIVAMQKQENAAARIQRLVQRFPDAALEVLRDTAAGQVSLPPRVSVALAYDRAFITPPATGWTRTFMDAAAHPGDYASIHQARLLALQSIEAGHPEKVAAQSMPAEGSAFPLAQADLLRLRGIAALLADRAADALRDWQAAGQLARADRGVSAEIFLLETLALRHDGAEDDSNRRWAMAASSACAVHDPGLWQRILDAKNPAAAWPAPVRDSFDPSSAAMENGTSTDSHLEANLWRAIGEWHFSRGENPGALIAFKQAETLYTQPREKAEARISQARALLMVNQSGAAVSILAALTTDPDPQVSHHALAVLGNARIALDDVAGALTLLQAAVANDDALPLALRAPARADLGLVYLLSSREKEGLNWLHQAQADFQADHDNAGLVQSLRNEAIYLEQHGRPDEAAALRNRALRISAAY